MNKIYNLDLSRTRILVDHTENYTTAETELDWWEKMFGTFHNSAISNFLYVIKVLYLLHY